MALNNIVHGADTTDYQDRWHTRCGYDQLIELLQICEDFFSQARPTALHEIDIELQARGNHGVPGWLIDMLGFTRLRLIRKDAPTTNPNE